MEVLALAKVAIMEVVVSMAETVVMMVAWEVWRATEAQLVAATVEGGVEGKVVAGETAPEDVASAVEGAVVEVRKVDKSAQASTVEAAARAEATSGAKAVVVREGAAVEVAKALAAED